MKTKTYTIHDFDSLVLTIADNGIASVKHRDIQKITDAVVESTEPVFWVTCVILGLRKNTSYATAARKLRRQVGL